jgi:Uma2 family endonuclease
VVGVTHVLPRGAPLTYDDLRAMPDDGHRYELVDGVLIVTPAPVARHQRAVARLIVLLAAAAGEQHDVLPAPFDYKVNELTVLQPDVLVARRRDIGPERLERTPLLVVEVQSPSTRRIDMGTKRLAFEAAGVPSYWLVDPDEPSLTVLELAGAEYREVARVTGEQAYAASRPFDVTVVPTHLLR